MTDYRMTQECFFKQVHTLGLDFSNKTCMLQHDIMSSVIIMPNLISPEIQGEIKWGK